MNDLITRLSRLDDSSGTGSTDIDVAGDLNRAHTALGRRRRTRAALAGTGLTLGVGAALGVAVVVGGDDATPDRSADPSIAAPGSERPAVALVAYEGAQPEGFELAKVPEGYVLQGSDSFVLTLATPGDDTHPLNFKNKLVIMLESQDAPQELGEGQEVDVNGEPGVIEDSGLARTLRYFQGDHLVVVQVWETIHLTDEQIVELAEGITVTDAVEAGIG